MKGKLRALLAVVALGLGCSKLPDFAAPQTSAMDPAELGSGDRIQYRALGRGDFLRQSPPGEVKFGDFTLGALTCTALYSSPKTQVRMEKKTFPNGRVEVNAWVENLRFHASMDRNCSWWNPDNHDIDYTLQHEQIHFALSELAARRMNQQTAAWSKELRRSGSDDKELVAELQGEIAEHLDDAGDALTDRQTEFDQDTSVGRNPERQQQWWNRVQAELTETSAWH